MDLEFQDQKRRGACSKIRHELGSITTALVEEARFLGAGGARAHTLAYHARIWADLELVDVSTIQGPRENI